MECAGGASPLGDSTLCTQLKKRKNVTFRLKIKREDENITRHTAGKKGALIAKQMYESQSAILNRFCKTRAAYMGACRFFNNKQVGLENLIEIAISPSKEAVAQKHVLCLQDSSEIELTHNSGKYHLSDTQLGPLTKETMCGFLLHPSLVLDASSGFPLAIADIYLWNRSFGQGDKYQRHYSKLAIELKESYRWPARALQAKQNLAKADRVTIIADREADIYEEFVALTDAKTDLLIRSKADRSLHGSDQKLFEALDKQPPVVSIMLPVKDNKKRKERTAHLELSYLSVKINKPKKLNKTLPAYVTLYAIQVKEKADSVPQGEQPIHWRLLTTHLIENVDQALQAVQWYSWRWNIEQLFRILKTQGLQIQKSQLESGMAMKKLCVMALHTALKIMQLIADRDNKIRQQATIILTAAQLSFLEVLILKQLNGKTVLQQNPFPSHSLARVSWAIGRLGGWKGYPSESPPGPITMLRGLIKFQQLFEGWTLAQQFATLVKQDST